jgi:hypothetical protein
LLVLLRVQGCRIIAWVEGSQGQALKAVRGRHWDQSPGLDGEVGAVDYQEAMHLLQWSTPDRRIPLYIGSVSLW